MIHYHDIIAEHGGDPGCYFDFDPHVDADHLHLLTYATLTAARRNDTGGLKSVVGVYEWQNAPLFMLVDGDTLGSNPDDFKRVRRLVALRGDAPYLAVFKAGRVTFHDVGLDNHGQTETQALNPTDAELAFAIPHIASNRPSTLAKERWISDVILKLLSDALNDLTTNGIDSRDAISIVGRALFARFLADRGLLEGQNLGEPEKFFDEHASFAKVSEWLDDTFNGDFLPLTADQINALPEATLKSVGNIMRRAPSGQLSLDWSEAWESLDFAHIPVGVLSQAYEQYLGTHDPDKQHSEGSYYTPRHIADLMVQASFAALQRDGMAHQAKILDPAAGAGVFLITAFRQLVKERWRYDQKRPDTKTLREILYNQVTGFDINDAALRFAALGLYLMSIELDGEPMPVSKLKFEKDLIGSVIFEFRKDDQNSLGSLGDKVGPEHLGKYDLVIGNPPWSKAWVSDKQEDLANGAIPEAEWGAVKKFVLQTARGRLDDEKANAPLPNEVLDLPFVWRAMEWSKPGAQIAFALHGRLQFQRGEGMDSAFRAILGSVHVTGIINGAEVRQSEVWPNVDAPFCLLFARNCQPPPGASFRFVSPHLEGPLTDTGGWRIDTTHAENVAIAEIQRHPETLKALYRGTRLDLEIFERMAGNGFPSLGEYWAGLEGHGGTARHPSFSGNGFGRLRKSSEPKPDEGGQRGQDAAHLYEYRVLEHSQFSGILLETSSYRHFRDLNMPRLHRCCDEAIYKGPMLLIRQSVRVGSMRFHAAVSEKDLVFNESYYGFTGHLQSSSIELVRYLCLVVSSKFALWHCLVTSGKFGVEREVVEKFVVQEVPLKPFDRLSPEERERARYLFDQLANQETEANWQQVDDWVASLYGLTPEDVQVISDTLELSQPSKRIQNAAQAPATPLIDGYCERLQAELQPWGELYDRQISVTHVESQPLSPWEFVVISANVGSSSSHNLEAVFKHVMLEAADTLSSSEIIYRDKANDCLYLGRLNQARYWSISQARLAARQIIWEHVDFLSGREVA